MKNLSSPATATAPAPATGLIFPVEAIPIFIFALVVQGLMVSSGANWYGLVVYGIYTLGLGLSFVFLRIKNSSPIMNLSASFSILLVSIVVMELIRFSGNQKEQNEKPAVQPLNILLWSIAGLLGFIFIIIGGFIFSLPGVFTEKILILIANTLFYCVIIFGLFYGSLVNSI